jgi:hypothetical protein
VRNLTLIKCTPGYPMSISGHPYVLGSAGMAHLPVIVERKRANRALTTAVRVQTIDFPSTMSAPPHERRT